MPSSTRSVLAIAGVPARWSARLRHLKWPRGSTLALSGILAFAAPAKFFISFLGINPQAEPADILEAAAWWVLYGAVLWAGLLASGEVLVRAGRDAGTLRGLGISALLALACAVAANVLTLGRSRVLIEQGVVQGILPMQLYAIALSFTLAMLYFALLDRTRRHEHAAARLAQAQAAQRHARRRMAQMELQAMQARVDPELLFDMLEAVKRTYETDGARAEQLLDELIAFLRASLPRLRATHSSVAREAELARAYVRLVHLSRGSADDMRLQITGDAIHARLAPGVLMPLVRSALQDREGACGLVARREGDLCRVSLELPAPADEGAIRRVAAVLEDAEGAPARIASLRCLDTCLITIEVPYEPA
jgi:hypothetical protein